jgi:hypothetical protein
VEEEEAANDSLAVSKGEPYYARKNVHGDSDSRLSLLFDSAGYDSASNFESKYCTCHGVR